MASFPFSIGLRERSLPLRVPKGGLSTRCGFRFCRSGSLGLEARDERRLQRLQKQMVSHKLLIIDELGFVPLSKT